ncbi:hypothetical protein KDAU_35230 [Dictyobacter aurantiacus]|uniref:Uncharacterized protein n=1 Tax=Dictyobacter aurantiacus TaxID=1936993 RepID=A0A401ZH30_9CHLR|nr:hypothetical protein KDAU_35230 [Dictyobacter aurantiacus]
MESPREYMLACEWNLFSYVIRNKIVGSGLAPDLGSGLAPDFLPIRSCIKKREDEEKGT